MWFTTVACFLFPAYFLLDVSHHIRFLFTLIFAKFKGKIRFMECSTIYGSLANESSLYLYEGLVLPSDVDLMLTHMNNARLIRELDFARIDHLIRARLVGETMRRGGSSLLSVTFVRYRLPLPIFSRYKIDTRVVWWDEKNVYLLFHVITLKDDIIRAVIYARATCIQVNVLDIVEKLNPGIQRPEMEKLPLDYKTWIETLHLSSQLMKAGNGGLEIR